MSAEQCQGITKQGNPCKKNAVADGFCKTHAGQASPDAQSAPEPKPSTASFDAIVNAGAKLVDSLEKAINHAPELMDKLFKYSGIKIMAPGISEKMQSRATDRIKSRLQKLQLDFINMGADPAKLDQLLEKTRKLEALVETTLATTGKYLPASLKDELKRSLKRLKDLRKK